jgi:hypothetical protein
MTMMRLNLMLSQNSLFKLFNELLRIVLHYIEFIKLPIAYFVYLYMEPSRGENHLEKFNRGSIMSCKLHMGE